MRNSPTPCTGPSAAARADSPSATLASSLTAVPSAVAAGPVHVSSAARSSRLACTRRAASSGSGSISIDPTAPSTSRRVPAGISWAPATPTTQGMPSCRAMMAVWLVEPPRSVTSATTTRGSRPAVSEGARSSATSTDGCLGGRHPRLGLADEVRDQAALDVQQVGRPLGHQPAHAGEDPDELLDRAVHRAEDVVAAGQPLGDGPAQALVPDQPGARREHLGGRVGGLVGLAHGSCRRPRRRRRRTPRAPRRRRRSRRSRSGRRRPGRPRCGPGAQDPRPPPGRPGCRAGTSQRVHQPWTSFNRASPLTVNRFGTKTT